MTPWLQDARQAIWSLHIQGKDFTYQDVYDLCPTLHLYEWRPLTSDGVMRGALVKINPTVTKQKKEIYRATGPNIFHWCNF